MLRRRYPPPWRPNFPPPRSPSRQRRWPAPRASSAIASSLTSTKATRAPSFSSFVRDRFADSGSGTGDKSAAGGERSHTESPQIFNFRATEQGRSGCVSPIEGGRSQGDCRPSLPAGASQSVPLERHSHTGVIRHFHGLQPCRGRPLLAADTAPFPLTRGGFPMAM